MAHQKSYTQIMAHSMPVLPLQIAALNGVSPMKPPVHTSHNQMDLWSHVSRQSSIHCSMPSTVVQIQGLHYSTWRPPHLMPNFPHLLRCCTTSRYVPPYHLGSTILTQQPYRFKSTLRTKLSMQSPVLMSVPSSLHHSILVSQLLHLTPEENLDTCYSSSCPSKEQLPSTHCKWNHLPPYHLPPLSYDCI